MSILAKLTTDKTIVEERDSVGGFTLLDSNIYLMMVDIAYITMSAGKAMALNVRFKAESGENLRAQFWMTSGEAKGCKNFYISKPGTSDETKHYLPGFNQANGMCLLTVGKEISTMDTEKKVINLYDSTAKKEVPTEVDMVTDLIKTMVYVGVLKQLVNKNVKDADSGLYVPTAETREQNEVDKVFCAKPGFEKLTLLEVRVQSNALKTDPDTPAVPVFAGKWLEKWEAKIQDKTKKDGLVTGAPGAARQTGAAAPTASLFGAPKA